MSFVVIEVVAEMDRGMTEDVTLFCVGSFPVLKSNSL
jgi:hypothetical protein